MKLVRIKKVNDINHLILSTTTDYSTDLICIELEKRGLKYLRLNRDHFPEYEINYTLQGDTLRINMGDTWYELSAQHVDSVYFRAPVFYRTTGKAYSLEEQLKRSQWSAFIRNMIVFDKAQWINYPPSVYQSENKLYQLKIAKECGMAVPETYIGNVLPNNIIPEKIYIVKSLDTALFYNNGKEMFTYSTMISGQELLEADLKLAPIILQEYLESKTDLRVTVVGDQIFPVAIMKHGKSITGDWRKTSKDDLEYIPVELPWGVTSQIIALMKKLNLTFGGIDLALVGGTYYFIEVNPTGEWGWLASVVNLPIDKLFFTKA